MDKFLKIAGIVALIGLIYSIGSSYGYDNGYTAGKKNGYSNGYSVGYKEGRKPTQEEVAAVNNYVSFVKDLYDVSGKYSQLYNLCENKYQSALNGDYTSAIRLNGQMDAIQADINTIMSKYPNNTNSQ